MNDTMKAARQKVEKTYNAAADSYDAEPLAFWETFGRRTVERLRLRADSQVLDVCCGAGASALPAAQTVGPAGKVVAIDLAENLLSLGRAKAKAAGIQCVEFRRGDMMALRFPNGQFDAVICVFGIFFAPDMAAQVAELWRLVRPGGQLAITTWGPDMFAPAYGVWLDAVQRARPDLYTSFNPWDRVSTRETIRELFAHARVPRVEVVTEDGHQTLRLPSDFWTIALGSGLRWTIDQMDSELAAGVKQEVLSKLEATALDRVATNVIYAVARREVDSA